MNDDHQMSTLGMGIPISNLSHGNRMGTEMDIMWIENGNGKSWNCYTGMGEKNQKSIAPLSDLYTVLYCRVTNKEASN